MLAKGQRVKLKNRAMLPDFFSNEGKIVSIHRSDSRICWVEFSYKGATMELNVHETELEEIDE